MTVFSRVISGVGRLANGNTLITSGVPGIIFEVTSDGETVWKYVNPVTAEGPLTQGDFIATDGFGAGLNLVFRAYRYAPDYPGLAGRGLAPQGPIEIVFDSDDDGLLDHEEDKIYGTERFVADTDSDGIFDGDEIRLYSTDPLLSNTDGDGLSDGDEILIYGTDPLAVTILGDVSCDDEVSSIDAALILQLTAGIVASLPCQNLGDVSGDGTTTSVDAALILQFTAGLFPSLPP